MDKAKQSIARFLGRESLRIRANCRRILSEAFGNGRLVHDPDYHFEDKRSLLVRPPRPDTIDPVHMGDFRESPSLFEGVKRWTDTGVYCELSGQDCGNCPISIFGVSATMGCQQPYANNLLKEKGLKIPPNLRQRHQRVWEPEDARA